MPVDLPRARDLARQLVDALTEDTTAIKPPIETTPISSADAFDRARSVAPAGAILTLDRTFRYAAPITLDKALTIQPAGALALERIAENVPLPMFLGGLTIIANGVTVIGVEVRQSKPAADLIVIAGGHVTLDRLRVLGDPMTGARRGIAANGNGNVTIIGCRVDDIFGPYPSPDNHDQQAICAWDMAPGLRIENNFLRAGTETIMLGGADSSNLERMPSDVQILGNTITKRAEWQTQPISVKNLVEFKACRKVTFNNNTCGLSWGGHGQDGYLFMLTVRNQSGHAPWSTIEDVDILDNTFTGGAAAINVLGRDNNQSSGVMARVRIRGNTFEELDPTGYTGSAKMIQIDGGPDALAISGNTFRGRNLTSNVYLLGAAKATQLVITDNTWPKTKYGIFGNNVSVGPADATNPAWRTYVASGTLSGNREA